MVMKKTKNEEHRKKSTENCAPEDRSRSKQQADGLTQISEKKKNKVSEQRKSFYISADFGLYSLLLVNWP